MLQHTWPACQRTASQQKYCKEGQLSGSTFRNSLSFACFSLSLRVYPICRETRLTTAIFEQAVEELNAKPKMWRDLLDDTPFTRKDIIHLQDPLNLSGRTLEQFDHIKKDLRPVICLH